MNLRELRFNKTPKVLVTAGLLVTVMVLLFSSFGAAPKAHPLLVDLAQESPDQLVRLIVQKSAENQRAEALAEKLGAEIVSDLSIIHAFSAEMTAADAVELSRSSAVRWVSLDAPMESAGIVYQDETMLDRFDVRSYSNDDGTQPWSGSWLEINDDNEADGGKIKIDKGELKLDDKNKGIQRSADLSLAETATLSFSYRRDNFDKPTKYVKLEISIDGGSTWTLLHTFADGDDDSSVPFNMDITPYMGTNTTIRFFTSPDDLSKLYVDNFKIDFSYTYEDSTTPPPDDGTTPPPDDGYLLEMFEVESYSNDDGTQPWSGSWLEINDDNQADGGKIKIDKGELKLDDKNKGIQRSADLSQAGTATLSLDYRRDNFDKPTKYVKLEVSVDGGATWTLLHTFADGDDDSSVPFNMDITPYMGTNTTIRFFTSPDDLSKLYVDNFRVDLSYTAEDNIDDPPADDPPVENPGDGTICAGDAYIIRDEFNTGDYSGNDGDMSWASDWVEIDDRED